MNKELLKQVGLEHYKHQDFQPEKVILRKGEEATIWVHQHTGHAVLDSESWVKEDYYSEDYRNEFSGNSSGKKIESEKHLEMYRDLNRRQFEQFKDKIDKDSKFLEVGSSFGGIIDNVLCSGVEVCHTVEPNLSDANFLKNKYPDIEIYNDTLEDTDLKLDYYDIVVSFEVLEHIVNPRLFLEKIKKSLKLRGIIHLEVPNHRDVLLSCYNKDTTYNKFFYHKAHIHYFTKESLYDLLSSCGFEGSISSFLMYPFFNHVYWHFNKGPQLTGNSALNLPIPTENRSVVEEEINNFYKQAEKEYEKLINKHVVGDCLIYQGNKIND
jgi:2-polyprenyl-3-methyl-5-hydroxy-6-metoxy-1,4-benzoquinol methylase